ncbi:MAG TPA: DNA-directed RNA polymerase subunit beta [Microbacteriaceae bacterium]|nr:DNA-directed RNA polymerase subunit beta [Microbacteriaceae bacterium]
MKRPAGAFDTEIGGSDPAELTRAAHESAAALLARARSDRDGTVGQRMTAWVDEHGLDTLAELWSRAHPASLPGALWRVYVVRSVIVQQGAETALAFERGRAQIPGIDPVIAGAATPAGPGEIRVVAEEILRGVYAGDVAHAFERAGAFARVCSAGYIDLAHDAEPTEPERASVLTTRADRLALVASELGACARLWRIGSLD